MAPIVAAVLLAIERVAYVWVWRRPQSFRALCDTISLGEPVVALERLFYGFKALQILVFAGWCYVFGDGTIWSPNRGALPIASGMALIAVGQVLNLGVFYRLGATGVFYGNRFGHELDWCRKFPFSLLDHPQYVGAVLSIWGFFLAMRFPHPDWLFLPALETAYYALGAWFEQ